MNGTDAIRAFWQGAMNMGIREAKLETVEVESREDLAYEIGKYTLTIQPEGAQKTTAAGKYVVVWKSQEGRWKLHVDIWNPTAA
jgi:ketosteroid isomerase-like protein